MLRTLVLPWQKEPQGRIFISYRRDDTQWVAGRLSDSLSQYFGDKRVFRDIEGIGGGADFSEVIHGTLGEADAAVILIGESWIDATDEAGQRRLDDPDDWVVQEIATALEAGIPVYPVLVEDTQMPLTDALPERLRPLTRLNAITVSDKRWDSDVARLAKSETAQYDSCASDWPLSLAQSGMTFLAIVPSSALLFVFARLVEETRRPWFLVAAWVGTIGTLTFFAGMTAHLSSQAPCKD